MIVRFVGSESKIMDTKFEFNRFGQRAEMPDGLAKSVMALDEAGHRSIPLLTEGEFSSLNITDDEVKENNLALARSKPVTPSFKSKRDAAWALLHTPVAGASENQESKGDVEHA